MSPDQVITEARARIIWGDRSSSVHDFLISNGVPAAAADAAVKEFVLERNRELRRIGFRDFVIGITVAGAAGGTLYLALPLACVFTSGWMKALGAVLLAGAYGLWKLGRGIVYLVRPQSEHESIPDIINSDQID
jgi:hypothetical protein